jgi:hypothetical protein
MFTWERPKTFLDLQRIIKAERKECRCNGESLDEKREYAVYRKALAAANKIVQECYPV